MRFRLTLGAGCGLFLADTGAAALLAPLLAPAGPFHTSTAILAAPSPALPMGADDLGRNVAVGVLYGARPSLLVAIGVTLIAGLLALLVGALAGYLGGLTDDLLMRAAEFSALLSATPLATSLGSTSSLIIVARVGKSTALAIPRIVARTSTCQYWTWFVSTSPAMIAVSRVITSCTITSMDLVRARKSWEPSPRDKPPSSIISSRWPRTPPSTSRPWTRASVPSPAS